jgi:putative DNA primase/helicase
VNKLEIYSREHSKTPDVFANLAELDRWAAWGGKTGKAPINPHTGANASTTKARDWGTRDQAENRCNRDELEGIGIKLGALGDKTHLLGLDLDNCLDDRGEINDPIVRKIVAKFRSYAEISPSGNGLKVVFTMTPEDTEDVKALIGTEKRTRKAWNAGNHHEIAIDLDRFYTVTEDSWDKEPLPIKHVSYETVVWLFDVAGPEYQRRHGASAKGKTRDDSGSGYGYRCQSAPNIDPRSACNHDPHQVS